MERGELEEALRSLGLKRGEVVFVHSSLSSIGNVEGGAETVVDAFLRVLGQDGTLIAPTFTFNNGGVQFDPLRDPSGMGRISEAIRTHPRALRSVHMYHSVAAVGRQAEEVASVQGASAWSGDGPFWQLNVLDARIVLLGVSYLSCTFFHVIEQLVDVPYRKWDLEEGQRRDRDGTVGPLTTRFFRQTPDSPGNDFNKLGSVLEERGVVRIQAVGNAVTRLFRAREALSIGVERYRQNRMIFARTTSEFTPLRDGVSTEKGQSVVDPSALFTADGQNGAS